MKAASKISDALRAAFRAMSALLFPQHCAICGRRLSTAEHGVCAACTLKLPYTRFEALRNNPVERLFVGRFPLCRASAFIFYNSGTETRNLLFDIKYHGNSGAAREMGRRMAEELKATEFFQGIDAIVPVPLARKRERRRGYNQSLMIAWGIAEIAGIAVDNKMLRRVVDNPTQTHLTPTQREDNVKGIFRAGNPLRINGKHILLIDDVVTTGATLTSCADTLIAAGAKEISILTLAASRNVGVW